MASFSQFHVTQMLRQGKSHRFTEPATDYELENCLVCLKEKIVTNKQRTKETEVVNESYTQKVESWI